MKVRTIAASTLLGLQLSPVLSQLVFPNIFPARAAVAQRQQDPIMNVPNIALPPSEDEKSPPPTGDVMISDVIGKERTINIFAGFTRDIEMIAQRLDDVTQNTTILAPLNSAMQKLSRKPWEDPRDYGALGEAAYDGSKGEDRAHQNLRRFVEAHVVPVSPWEEGEKVETLGGRKLWWENSDGKRLVGILLPVLPSPS